ncbi:type II toxin-antitoxin system Phd/YefM family antitoxin [Cyanobacterium aponinum]|uniref:Prevent-host-death protein n=1 Tax=Cyanobacterium aponinum 0216 TaxID=2676140 RepID=A0A844GV22_9CHRO|nr:type II toxin-antitoxin system Phd/YefM family antitoxin [Cyanobacterium aponinum]MTF40307.1 prevent-host-death protein [Cyanobacterium aponinum 0216]
MEITKTQFKAEFDEILEQLNRGNEDIIIVDNGQPILKVSKYQKNSLSTAELFAPLRGKVKYYEDLTSPTTEEWSEV